MASLESELRAIFAKWFPEIPDRINTPVYHLYQTGKLLSSSRTPDDVLEEMSRLGLPKAFIDWVAQQGYRFKLTSDRVGVGMVSSKTKEIEIGSNGDDGDSSKTTLNLTKVHELIHLATPRTSTRECFASLFYFLYEEVIDQIAKPFSEDLSFMSYLDSQIPTLKGRRGRDSNPR